jgi:hypothetical protein
MTEFIVSLGLEPFWTGLLLGLAAGLVVRAGSYRTMREPLSARSRTSPPQSLAAGMMRSSLNIRVASNGTDQQLSEAQSAELMAAIEGGNSIEAIKRVREWTGLDLKSAKELVDVLARSRG